MEMNYEVLLDGVPVGKIQLTTCGLYLHMFCICQTGKEGIHRLVAIWNRGHCNLGIPAPEDGSLVLKRKIAAKHIKEEDLRFVLVPINQAIEESDYIKDKVSFLDECNGEVTTFQLERAESDSQKVPDDKQLQSVYDSIPVVTGEPFPLLDAVEDSRLFIHNREATVHLNNIHDQMEIDKPTGQWSDPNMSA